MGRLSRGRRGSAPAHRKAAARPEPRVFVVRIGELSTQKDEGVKKSLYLPPENDGDTSRSGAESAPERRFGERTARKPRQEGMPRRRNETTDDRTVLHSVFLARGQRPEPRHGRVRIGQHHRDDPALRLALSAVGPGPTGCAPRRGSCSGRWPSSSSPTAWG